MIKALRTGAPLPGWSLAFIVPGLLAVPGLGVALGVAVQHIV